MKRPGEEKTALRALVRERLQGLDPAARQRAAVAVCEAVVARPEWQRARSVLLFAPLPDEIDVGPLLEGALAAGKRVFLPARLPGENAYGAREVGDPGRDLVAGRFGVREPAGHCPWGELGGLDFAVIPGLGFDASGGRLGRGKGYYDRMLAGFGGVSCGVAFAEQMLPAVPVESHDVRLDLVVTPGRTWVGGGRAS